MTFEQPLHRFCSIFGHNFKHVASIDENTSELVCKSCENHFISTENGNVVNLSAHEETVPLSTYFKRKRTSRLNTFIGFKIK